MEGDTRTTGNGRYGVALVSVALATGLRLLLDPVLADQFPFATFFLAVMLTAGFGGFGPAMTAVILGGLASSYFLLPPRDSFSVEGGDQIAGLALYLTVSVGMALLGGAMRSGRKRLQRAREAERRQREQLQVTLTSIGDAVIATDQEGRVTFLNPMAQRLTGWMQAAAQGQPLETVFKIVNEETGLPVANPALRALHEGAIVGLAPHAVLIARDGTRLPVDDSAAPMRDASGKAIGAVLVFRDIVERKQSEAALAERIRLLALEAEVGKALTENSSLPHMLRRSAEALVVHLDGAFARIWTLNSQTNVLELQASAGLYTHLDGPHSRIPVGQYKIGLIAEERQPHLTNSVVGDPRVSDQEWARQQGMVAFAGYPLIVDNRVVGVMAMFARQPLSDTTLKAMESVANGIAVGIERKRAEEHLQQREQELTDFFENAAIGLHWVGPDGIILRANPADFGLLGYSREEYLGHHIAEFHADQEVISDILTRLQQGERLHEYPARLVCKDGTIKDVLIDSSVRWKDDRFVHTRCFTRDVTRQKQALEQLRFHSELLDRVEQATIVTDPDGKIIYWNAFAETLYGWKRDEALGRHVIELIVAPANIRQAAQIMQRLREGESWSGEVVVKRRNGTMFPAFVTDTPVFDDQGQLKAIIGISANITDRKRSEQTARFLADASASLAVLVDYDSTLQRVAGLAMPDFADWVAVDVLEKDGTLRRLAVAHSDSGKAELARELNRRYPPDPDAPHGVWSILRTGKSEIVSEITEEFLTESSRDAEQLRMLKDLGPKSYIGVPLEAHGKSLGVMTFIAAGSNYRYDLNDLAVAEDLAHRAAIAIENARLYRELREADHRKDEFLAMLAHELRNPLAPIRSGLDVLALNENGDADTVRLMQQQVEHLVRLVDDLLDVSRIIQGKVELRREPVVLSSIIQRSVDAARAAISQQALQLSVSVPDDAIWINADPVRLVQVVQNLLNNATKYNNHGGHIDLNVRSYEGGVCISVEDDGIGIDADLLPSVFDLFTQSSRTLDRSQGGLGIGLTLVRNLVELHGGSVSAFSAGPGCGSRFQVFLPIVQPVEAPTRESPQPSELIGHRVLLVEDNVGAAKVLAMLIQRLGPHEVQVAHDGPSALEIASRFQPEIVLLDIGLPRMDGYTIARALRADAAGSALLLAALTGYGQEEDRRKSHEAGFDEHMVKPVGVDTLRQLLCHPKLARETSR